FASCSSRSSQSSSSPCSLSSPCSSSSSVQATDVVVVDVGLVVGGVVGGVVVEDEVVVKLEVVVDDDVEGGDVDGVCANTLDRRGVFTQHYETDALDASVLLMPLVRFLPPEDERVRRTVSAIADELTVDGLVLRYKVEETDDGLAGEEGTFTICSFWLV